MRPGLYDGTLICWTLYKLRYECTISRGTSMSRRYREPVMELVVSAWDILADRMSVNLELPTAEGLKSAGTA